MKFNVVFQDVVWDDLDAIPSNVRKRILSAIEKRLTTHPTQYGLKLRQALANLWKIRVGDYRVVYEMDGSAVIIWAILNRKQVYPEVTRRWMQ
jgi:mRNA interferase RelE/StbE